jgi:hypothetical protein
MPFSWPRRRPATTIPLFIRRRGGALLRPRGRQHPSFGDMMSRVRNRKDFWSAVMFVIFGLLFMGWSADYQIGTAQRMGPGYFPMVLGALLVGLGILVGLPSIRRDAVETRIEGIGWRGLGIILGSVALYAFLLPRLGFVVSLVMLIVLSSLATREFTWKATLLSVVVLAISSYFVFVKGLDLQFPVWPPFLTR